MDNDGGEVVILGKTYYYQVRPRATPQLLASTPRLTQSITVTSASSSSRPRIFAGVGEVFDPKACDALVGRRLGAGDLAQPDGRHRLRRVPLGDGRRSRPDRRQPDRARGRAAGADLRADGRQQGATVSTTTYTDTNVELNRVY